MIDASRKKKKEEMEREEKKSGVKEKEGMRGQRERDNNEEEHNKYQGIKEIPTKKKNEGIPDSEKYLVLQLLCYRCLEGDVTRKTI